MAETGYRAFDSTHPSFARRTLSGSSSVMSRRMSVANADKAEVGQAARWAFVGLALFVSLVAFGVQTELAQYIQRELKFDKPYFMLYITHGSWFINAVLQFAYLRLTDRSRSTTALFWRHLGTIEHVARIVVKESGFKPRSIRLHMVLIVLMLTLVLTVAASTWYISINMTSASDVSAIYNCSAFTAYVFSIPLLGEKFRIDKAFAVAVSLAGVFMIAYDSADSGTVAGSRRLLGNLLISVGAVLYGLYEVLYKKYACTVSDIKVSHSIEFANIVGSSIGLTTLLVFWIPIPVLHFTGYEVFELPHRDAIWALVASVVSNFVYTACLLTMISLTSPVLSSVACLLSIFVVALVDTLIRHQKLGVQTMLGGVLIIIAFCMLASATYREMQQHQRKAEDDEAYDDEENEEDEDDEDNELVIGESSEQRRTLLPHS